MIEAVIFDAYGTLFDVHSVVSVADKAFPGYGHKISQIWRQKQLEYTWLRSLMHRYADFESVNREALGYTLNHLKLDGHSDTIHALLNAYHQLEPYPEVTQALERLSPRTLAILSNGTLNMIETATRHAGMTPYFKHILSVDSLQTYKPDPQVYQYAVSTLRVPRERLLFVSSNGWDAAGAKSFGFIVGWINRQNQTPEALGVRPDFEAADLTALVDTFSL